MAPNEVAQFRAVALDDAERAPERALLHLYNCCIEAGASLLVVAREAAALADRVAGSRLAAARRHRRLPLRRPTTRPARRRAGKALRRPPGAGGAGRHRLSRPPNGALVRRLRHTRRAARPHGARRRAPDHPRARPPRAIRRGGHDDGQKLIVEKICRHLTSTSASRSTTGDVVSAPTAPTSEA